MFSSVCLFVCVACSIHNELETDTENTDLLETIDFFFVFLSFS